MGKTLKTMTETGLSEIDDFTIESYHLLQRYADNVVDRLQMMGRELSTRGVSSLELETLITEQSHKIYRRTAEKVILI